MLALPERVIVDHWQSKHRYKEVPESKGTLSWPAQFEQRNALFGEVRIQNWLEDIGIPYDMKRRVKSSRKSYLTASNVSQSQLEKVYRWSFYNSHVGDSSRGTGSLVTRHINKLLMGETSIACSSSIKISEEWLGDTNLGVNEVGPSQMLSKALLLYLEYANEEHITRQSPQNPQPPLFDLSADQTASAGPALDLRLYDSHNAHSSRVLSMETTVLKLLAFPGIQNTISEMDVERQIGSILTGIFNIRGCTTYSSTALKYPTILGCFGSYSRPDVACQISVERLPGIKFCRPLVLAGEARRPQNRVPQKDAPSGSATPSDESPVRLPRPALKLAWAFQPTLELFIMDLITRYGNPSENTWKKEWDPLANAAIPSHMVVFGIVYDKNGIVVYSYAPTYSVSNGKVKWGFECRQVSPEHEYCFNGEYSVYKRALLLRALLAIVGWSEQLATKWAHDLSLPAIVAALDEKWESVAI